MLSDLSRDLNEAEHTIEGHLAPLVREYYPEARWSESRLDRLPRSPISVFGLGVNARFHGNYALVVEEERRVHRAVRKLLHLGPIELVSYTVLVNNVADDTSVALSPFYLRLCFNNLDERLLRRSDDPQHIVERIQHHIRTPYQAIASKHSLTYDESSTFPYSGSALQSKDIL